MKITYDAEVDVLDITLKKGKVARTVEIAPEALMDLDSKGVPLHLEIVGASEKIGRKNFSDVVVGNKNVRLSAFVS
ncbi:hypothetical protein A3A21_01970 [Candidatus Jorgensenbacteria bacterium RIFCSPLOWO2_01_FULL_45_25b]|uniref:DUF2283 domain-containing protein n=1 Tax=Candidatus Jorgensenbacteria bacterium RIFCSPLOWO2_01_FULL_45_25b TaxID=1798471 RepID=A0A1F6BZ88_9BACT|nr:MAG: hypothetical protein A3A21_01970 [Candidatus Jorgensenbacteria bacterium RIFCSPLOWO2_01_FULL_45_25b]